MAILWATLFIGILILCLTLHALNLPANWIIIGLVTGWLALSPGLFDWQFLGLLAGVALVSEAIQFVSQIWAVKKFGGTSKSNWWAIIGSFVGAIFGAPFFFGLGALVGAFAGAYGGAYLAEWSQGRTPDECSRSAWGAFVGTFLGLAAKFGLGVYIVLLTAKHIWPA